MSALFLFDILEERLECLSTSRNSPAPLRVVQFLRFLWNTFKSLFAITPHGPFISQYDHHFIAQKCTWDCGIACCNMILQWSGNPHNHNLIDYQTVENGSETPLWTIELFSLLKDRNIEVKMYTSCKGINPAHKDLSWYANSNESEILTTTERFDEAVKQNWKVYEEKLSLQHLKTLLVNEQYAAIVLVDVGLLYGRPNEDYSGHYIVVLDYIAHTEEFVCLNPAHGPGAVHIAAGVLERARTHVGTDQDILICQKQSTHT